MSKPTSIWNKLRGFFDGKQIESAPEQSHAVTVAEPKTVRVSTVSAPPVDLILGIDLGTSCTKVVIGEPNWQDKSFAVSFSANPENLSAWLHPTRFHSEANLKMRLMDNPESQPDRDLVACYLAEVIKISRAWFTDNAPAAYRQRTCSWSLNLGFAGKKTTGSPLAVAYREVADLAVRLASMPEAPTLQAVAKLRGGKMEVDPFIPFSRIQLYPEIAAQLAGYVNSPHVKKGNLLLIDVGAGTLDVSTIILHGTRDKDVVSFHVCEVESLGVLRLFKARSDALTRLKPSCMAESLSDFQDGLRPIPESFEDMVKSQSRSSRVLAEEFRKVSDDFASEIIRVPLSCLSRFKGVQQAAHDTGRAFDPWKQKLRFFLTGGGSRSSFYRRSFVGGSLENDFSRLTRWHHDRERRLAAGQGLHLEEMPKPTKLVNFPAALSGDFDRLSVAYGLAFGGQNLMSITDLGND